MKILKFFRRLLTRKKKPYRIEEYYTTDCGPVTLRIWESKEAMNDSLGDTDNGGSGSRNRVS